MTKGSYRGGSTIIRPGDLARQALLPKEPEVPIETVREIQHSQDAKAAELRAQLKEARKRSDEFWEYLYTLPEDDCERRYYEDHHDGWP